MMATGMRTVAATVAVPPRKPGTESVFVRERVTRNVTPPSGRLAICDLLNVMNP